MAIREALRECGNRCDALICFGGLGPTTDDRTVDVVSQLLGTRPIFHEPSKRRLTEFYERRNREVDECALRQVRYPEKSLAFENLTGLAPGFCFQVGKCTCYCLPGVPLEMEAMFTQSVLPLMNSTWNFRKHPILSRTFRCIGIHESELQRQLNVIEEQLGSGCWLGYRTIYPENHATLYFRKKSSDEQTHFNQLCGKLHSVLSKWCYSEDNQSLEQVVLGELAKRNWRVALAESCTGGLALHRLTRIPGSSEQVWGGCVAYQIEAKDKMLGIPLKTKEMAVSAQCAQAMAAHLKDLSGCEVAAAITGYMGPTGGTSVDPIGTLYMSAIGERSLQKHLVQTGRSREQTQWGASSHLLNLVRVLLQGPRS